MNNSKNYYIRAEVTLTLTTLTELLIGTNSVAEDTSTADPTFIKMALKGVDDNPFIPASTVKGCLRSLVTEQSLMTEDEVVLLFGNSKGQSDKALSKGCLLFGQAFSADKDVTTIRRTHVAVDELTGTAKENHLFTLEKVVPGNVFKCRLRAKMIDKSVWEKLLRLLKNQELSLGSGTSNSDGMLCCELTNIRVMDNQQFRNWVVTGGNNELGSEEDGLLPFSEGFQDSAASDNSLAMTLNFSITSPDPILIADPILVEKRKKEVGDDDRVPDLIGCANEAGEPYLPASSLRGLLRAQYRRIVRTLARNYCIKDKTNKLVDKFCEPLWGSTRFKSAIVIRDAIHVGEHCVHEQSLIAIDRFTGGVAKGNMLSVEAYLINAFDWSLTLNTALMAPKFHAQRVILLMVIRDMMEGEMIIGAKKAAGYGRLKFSGKSPSNTTDKLPENWDVKAFASQLQVDLDKVDSSIFAEFNRLQDVANGETIAHD